MRTQKLSTSFSKNLHLQSSRSSDGSCQEIQSDRPTPINNSGKRLIFKTNSSQMKRSISQTSKNSLLIRSSISPIKPEFNFKDNSKLSELCNKIFDNNSLVKSEQIIETSPYEDKESISYNKTLINKIQLPKPVNVSTKIKNSHILVENTIENQSSAGHSKNINSIESGAIGIFDSLSHYKYSKGDSKYDEIQDLRKQVAMLKQENSKLKQELRDIDEFRIALEHKRNLEEFNERRCDLLKGQLIKQRRYIDYLSSSVKLTKKFYRDSVNILDFLLELNDKYINCDNVNKQAILSYLKDKENQKNKAPNSTSTQAELNLKSINDIYSEMGSNKEEFRKFMENFNEAYIKAREIYEPDDEMKKVVGIIDGDTIHVKNPSALQKKLKYHNLLGQFFRQHKKIFPIYTIFNDFDSKDKDDFGNFVGHLIAMSKKIDEVIGKINNFELIRHDKFIPNDTPKFLIDHAAIIENYFGKNGAKKRIFLNGEEILKTEKILSNLLNEIINMHRIFIVDKNLITVDLVLNIEENLRISIEQLLCLGIFTHCADSTKQSISVINKIDRQDVKEISSPNANVNSLERLGKFGISIYKKDEESLRNFDHYSSEIQRLFSKLELILNKNKEEGISNDAVVRGINHLKNLYKILFLNQKDNILSKNIKELELKFLREYAAIITTDSKRMEKFVNDKSDNINHFVNIVEVDIKLMIKAFEPLELSDCENKDAWVVFRQQFKQHSNDIMNLLQKIMNPKTNFLLSEVSALENIYKKEYQKIEEDYCYLSQRMNGLQISVNSF